MENKNIVVFGCKKTTRFILDNICEKYNICHIITISPQKNSKVIVPDYYDLRTFAEDKNIPIYHCNKYSLQNDDDINFINKLNIDIAFVMGWQRLIPEKILDNVKIGVYGMHGSSSNLPKGRGRSPMNWSIIEGRKHFYTNLFKYNAGIDDGDIVDTVKFSITDRDTAETMHFKNMISMKFLILKNINSIISDNISLTKQGNKIPTYYPKRNPSDSLIDWDLDIYKLERFIRAVTKPFNGAYSFIDGEVISIYDSQVFDVLDFGYKDYENGVILEVLSDDKFLVKANGGVLLVNNFSSNKKIKNGDRFNNGKNNIKYFKFNNHGFFDI